MTSEVISIASKEQISYGNRGNSTHYSPTQSLEKIGTVFEHALHSHIEPQSDKERCFEAVLTAVENNEWSKIEEVYKYFSALKNVKSHNLFIACVAKGRPEYIQEIGKRGLLHGFLCGDAFNETFPLHMAASLGLTNLMGPLMGLGFPVQQMDEEGYTPMHRAMEGDHKKIVKLLLDSNASWKTTSTQVEFSPLFYAVKCGAIKCFDVLMAFLDEHRVTPDQLAEVRGVGNFLHVAIQFGQERMLKHLLNKYSEFMQPLIDKPNVAGQIPLILAATLGDLFVIKLLKEQKADLEAGDSKQRTAMHWATLHRKRKVIEYLFGLGAKVRVDDENNIRPLDLVRGKDDFASQQTYGILSRLINMAKMGQRSVPNFTLRPPENLVFEGGGARGLAYIGVVQALEDREMLKDIERVAGTSVGAILAALIAVGCGSKEIINALLGENSLSSLLESPELITPEISASTQNSLVKKLFKIVTLPFTVRLGELRLFAQSLPSFVGLCTGDKLRNRIEQSIAEQTGIENCTFGELSQSVSQGKTAPNGMSFKHLHVFGTQIGINVQKIFHFSSEHAEWKDLIISDTVCISGAFPGVFKPRPLFFKHSNKRFEDDKTGEFLDGGMLRCFPIKTFDRKKYISSGFSRTEGECEATNKRTLAFSLRSPKELTIEEKMAIKDVMNAKDLVKALISVFRHGETLIQEEGMVYDRHRTVSIGTMDGGALETNLFQEKKKLLIESGKSSTVRFFEEGSSGLFPAFKSQSSGIEPSQRKDFPSNVEPPKGTSKKIKERVFDDPMPSTIGFFIGREKELNLIEECFQARGVVVAPPITGFGGIGKTQFVLELIDKLRQKHDYEVIVWITAKSDASIVDSYLYVADYHGLAKGENEQAQVREAKKFLIKKHCLYVFDSAQDYFSIESYVPKSQRCKKSHVLITSRNSLSSDWRMFSPMKLSPFTKGEAIDLAKTFGRGISNPGYLSSLGEVFDLFPRYPLALVQLLSVVKGKDPQELIQKLSVDRELCEILSEKVDKQVVYDQAMTFIVKENLKKINNALHGEKAINLLIQLSYLEPNGVPEDWVLTFNLQTKTSPKTDITSLLVILEQSSFIQWDREEKEIYIHATIQTIIRQQYPQSPLSFLIKDIVSYLGASDRAYKNLKKWGVVLPHGRSLFKYLSSKEDKALISNKLFHLCDKLCLYEECLKWAEKNFEIVTKLHAGIHPDVATALNNLGKALVSTGNSKRAHELFIRVLDMRTEIYGGKIHEELAFSLNMVGISWARIGNSHEAMNYILRAHNMVEEIYCNKDHRILADSYTNVGFALRKVGCFKDGRRCSMEALEMKVRIFIKEPHNPSISYSLSNVGSALEELGKLKQALEYHTEALEMNRTIYEGLDHPFVANSLHRVASVLGKLGDWEQALDFAKKSTKYETDAF